MLDVRQHVRVKKTLVFLVKEDEFLLTGKALQGFFERPSGDVGPHLEFVGRYPGPAGIEHVPQNDFLIGAMQQRIQGYGRFPFAVAFVFAWERVENGSPANGLDRRIGTEHKAVSAKGGNGLVEADLDEGLLTGQQFFPVEEHCRGKMLCRPGVEADFCSVLEGARGAGEQLQLDIDQVRGHQSARHGDHIAALDEGPLHGLKVDRRALAGMNLLHLIIVNLQTSDLGLVLHRVDHDRVADTQLSGNTRSGYDGPEPAHAENAIHRQAKRAIGAAGSTSTTSLARACRSSSRPSPVAAETLMMGLPSRNVPFKKLGHIFLNHLEPIGIIHEIDFREDDQPLFHPKQFADLHVFPRLGHDPFIGRNHQGDKIDAGGSGDHVLHKALMARNIDDSQTVPTRKVHVGKAQLDGDAAQLFLFEAVGVDARQSSYERGLAVVDVPCGAKNNLFHAMAHLFGYEITKGKILRILRRPVP